MHAPLADERRALSSRPRVPRRAQAEISTISKMSSVRVKLLVGQLVKRAVDGSIDYGKVQKLATGTIGEGDVQAAVAALHFLLMGAAKHDVEEVQLAKELEQLGVPKEHSDAVCKPYAKDKEALRAELTRTTLSIDKLTKLQWRVNVAKEAGNGATPSQGNVGTSGGTGMDDDAGGRSECGAAALSVAIDVETERLGKVAFDASEAKFRMLLLQLKAARDRLDT